MFSKEEMDGLGIFTRALYDNRGWGIFLGGPTSRETHWVEFGPEGSVEVTCEAYPSDDLGALRGMFREVRVSEHGNQLTLCFAPDFADVNVIGPEDAPTEIRLVHETSDGTERVVRLCRAESGRADR